MIKGTLKKKGISMKLARITLGIGRKQLYA